MEGYANLNSKILLASVTRLGYLKLQFPCHLQYLHWFGYLKHSLLPSKLFGMVWKVLLGGLNCRLWMGF